MESFKMEPSPERVQKLLRKRLEDKLHAKKYRRQLRELGFYLSKEDSGITEAPEGQPDED